MKGFYKGNPAGLMQWRQAMDISHFRPGITLNHVKKGRKL